MTTPPASLLTQPFDLHVPVGTVTLFQQRIAEIPEAHRNSWRYHRVAADDSLASVARSYHVSVEQLATVNQLQASDSLDNIDALVIPVALPSAPISHVEVYKTRRGDSLVTIADRFGVSIEDLRRWNHLSGSTVAAGKRVRVAEPAHVAAHARDHGVGRDKSGRDKSGHDKSGHEKSSHEKSSHDKSNPKPEAKSKAAKGSVTARQGSKAEAKKSSSAHKKGASTATKSSDAKKTKGHAKSSANNK
jgi:membrane-bound lytic murein transglycosylase D